MSHGEKGNRPLRVAAEIRRDLPEIIRRLVSVPEGTLVSITEVEVSADLGMAKVFFSVVGGREESLAKSIERELNARRGVLRSEIARRLFMRQHPDLRFIYDETPARAARIESLLNRIQNESQGPDREEDS